MTYLIDSPENVVLPVTIDGTLRGLGQVEMRVLDTAERRYALLSLLHVLQHVNCTHRATQYCLYTKPSVIMSYCLSLLNSAVFVARVQRKKL